MLSADQPIFAHVQLLELIFQYKKQDIIEISNEGWTITMYLINMIAQWE